MIVLDASAAVEWLLRTPRGLTIAVRVARPREEIHVPHLFLIEVTQVLRRYRAAAVLNDARAEFALQDLRDMRLVRYSHDPFLARVWALRHNLSAYDGVYIALAEALDAPLLTCDARVAAAPGHKARIKLF